MRIVRQLFQEYAAWLNIDLCFQAFDQELETLPGAYAAPDGSLLLAECRGEYLGCAALRKIGEGIGEVKRLYVVPAYRGQGIGRKLMETIINDAKAIGFSYLRLDTLANMESARQLYTSLGFYEIPPYYHNPIEGAVYMELLLEYPRRRTWHDNIFFTPLA